MLEQLRQRNVHRVAAAYLAAAWLIIQVIETLTPDILPAGALRVTVIVAAIGFIPSLVFAWIFEWTPEGLKRERAVQAGTPLPDSRRFDRVIMIMLAIAVSFFAVDKFVVDPVRDREQIEAATTAAVEDALASRLLEKYAHRSVLVLPFRNVSEDASQEYFADGIAEELLNLLTKIEELRVISRATSWTFKGKDIDIAAIREKLDVSHILEGSVRKAGNQIRITAQLIDARSDSQLWSDTYDRTLDDIFAIQDEISVMVVDRLKLELLAGPPSAEEIDPVAYDLYLQGKHLTHTVQTNEALGEAIELLSRAVELAPDYVPAIWELARAISSRAPGDTLAEKEAKDMRVHSLVDRLVELAPDSSYANGWLGFFAEEEGDLQAAALYREKSVAASSDSNLYVQLAIAARMLADLGRTDEAEVLARYVVDRDPACTTCVNFLVLILRKTGRHREAAEEIEKLLEWQDLPPYYYWHLGVAWLVAGEPGKSLTYFEHTFPGNRKIGQMLALHDLDRLDEFNAEFLKLRANPEAHPETIARIAAWTGQNDLAFEYLERAIGKEGPQIMQSVKRGGDLYEPIMSDPRWQALLDRYGIADEDLSHIRFNPKLPTAVAEALQAAE